MLFLATISTVYITKCVDSYKTAFRDSKNQRESKRKKKRYVVDKLFTSCWYEIHARQRVVEISESSNLKLLLDPYKSINLGSTTYINAHTYIYWELYVA